MIINMISLLYKRTILVVNYSTSLGFPSIPNLGKPSNSFIHELFRLIKLLTGSHKFTMLIIKVKKKLINRGGNDEKDVTGCFYPYCMF